MTKALSGPIRKGSAGPTLKVTVAVPAERLPEDVFDLAADRDPVGGAALGGPADGDGIAQDVDRYAGDLRLDLQHALVGRLRHRSGC